MAKAPAPKKEKNPPPVEEDDDVDIKKGKGKGEGDEEAPQKGGGQLKLILIIVAAVVVSAGGAFFAALKIVGGGSPPPVAGVSEGYDAEAEHGAPPVAPQRASGGHGAPPPPAESGGHGGGGGEEAAAGHSGPVTIESKPFIVNLNDLGGRRMLKLSMSVDADSQELADEINAKMPKFRDTILLLLSSIQSDDVSGMDGKQRLKNQMLNRINPNLTRGKIRDLYFSEIVVQ
jgi:flagellar FliL protein